MNIRIRALLKKDLKLFISNRFYFLITVLGLVFYVVAYFVLPSQVEENLSLAVYAKEVPPAFTLLTEQEGAEVLFYPDKESQPDTFPGPLEAASGSIYFTGGNTQPGEPDQHRD